MFAAVSNGRWHWGLGDPSPAALLVTAFYFFVVVACLMIGRRVRSCGQPAVSGPTEQGSAEPVRSSDLRHTGQVPFSSVDQFFPRARASGRELRSADSTREAPAWWFLAALMFCLGVNKQADFQSLLTLYGRDLLRDAGLYESRRVIQVAFIVGVVGSASLITTSLLWITCTWSWPCRLAAVGVGLQAAFVVIRASSFHHVDRLLGIYIAQMKMNLALESIGLFMILWAAIARGRMGSREKELLKRDR